MVMARPEDLTDLVWSWFTTSQPGLSAPRPGTKESLAKLIDEAYAASLQVEEGRPVRLQLLIDHRPNQVTARFEDPLPYTASNLVKLAPTIDLGFRWLIIAPAQSGGDSLDIIGICDPELSPAANEPRRNVGGGLSAHQPNPLGMKLSVMGPGYIRIEAELQFFELRNCHIRRPHSVGYIPIVREWFKEVGESFVFAQMPVDSGVVFEPQILRHSGRVQNAGELVRRTLGSILSKVSDARHGGTILVIPKAADVSRLVDLRYPLPTDVLRSSIEKRASFEPGLSNWGYRESMKGSDLDRAHFSERDLARASDLLTSFTAVDGAVILDRDLNLLGYGAEILETEPRAVTDAYEVVHIVDGESQGLKRLGDFDFGMRHRSAGRFCQKVNQAIAFVVSQDGGLRVFGGKFESRKASLYDGSTPEGWVIAAAREAKNGPTSAPASST